MATAHVDTRKFLSETKFYEGYSRYIEEQGRYEDWNEAVDRVIEMHENNYKEKNNELAPYMEEARQAYKEQRVLGAQRALQFGGVNELVYLSVFDNLTFEMYPAVGRQWLEEVLVAAPIRKA